MATRRGPDNSVRWSVKGTMQGIPWANVFWAQLTPAGTITQSDFDAWLIAAFNAHQAFVQTRAASTVLASGAAATLFLPGNLSLQSTYTSAWTGSAAGTPCPDQSACAITSWKSGVYWRGGKPRTYSPGVVTTDITLDKSLTGARATAQAAAAATFRTTMNAIVKPTISATVMGFVSFSSGNTPRVTPLFFPITGAAVHPRLGSQRRHLGKWAP